MKTRSKLVIYKNHEAPYWKRNSKKDLAKGSCDYYNITIPTRSAIISWEFMSQQEAMLRAWFMIHGGDTKIVSWRTDLWYSGCKENFNRVQFGTGILERYTHFGKRTAYLETFQDEVNASDAIDLFDDFVKYCKAHNIEIL